MILGVKNITLEDCINLYKRGWMAIVSNGKVVCFFKKKGASV